MRLDRPGHQGTVLFWVWVQALELILGGEGSGTRGCDRPVRKEMYLGRTTRYSKSHSPAKEQPGTCEIGTQSILTRYNAVTSRPT